MWWTETWRKPVGRPWLTVAIDVHSRCVAGLHLSFEAPSATVAGLCLAHAALDKAIYLSRLGVEANWPCQGRPGEVFVDNGPEFHSDAFGRGCGQHGITLRHRPKGAPHWGGIVERLVGTAMGMVHELPGTTFSNPAERGEYDSAGAACLTLAELERWLVLAVTGPYHNSVHGGLGEPPLARWRAGVAEHGAPPAVADSQAFLIDFLPVLRRRVTREGIVCDHIAYYNDAAQGWAAVDEETIFRAVAQQREVVHDAAQRTRSARRQVARTADAARGAPARKVSEPSVLPSNAVVEPTGTTGATYELDPYPAEQW